VRKGFLTVALLACLSHGASAGGAECQLLVAGQQVLAGACEASAKEPSGSVRIASPDATVVARIESSGGGVGKAFWNEGVKDSEPDTLIGPVVLIGACWSSDKIKLCVTR
jgi:hypothetical protein